MLGGFPMDDTFRNYTADASTLVVTYPLDSSPSNRSSSRLDLDAVCRCGRLHAICVELSPLRMQKL